METLKMILIPGIIMVVFGVLISIFVVRSILKDLDFGVSQLNYHC